MASSLLMRFESGGADGNDFDEVTCADELRGAASEPANHVPQSSLSITQQGRGACLRGELTISGTTVKIRTSDVLRSLSVPPHSEAIEPFRTLFQSPV